MPLAAVPHIYNKTFLSNLPGNGHVLTLFPDEIKTMTQDLSLIHCPFPPLELYLSMTYSNGVTNITEAPGVSCSTESHWAN